jgi:hypothetical protein
LFRFFGGAWCKHHWPKGSGDRPSELRIGVDAGRKLSGKELEMAAATMGFAVSDRRFEPESDSRPSRGSVGGSHAGGSSSEAESFATPQECRPL